MLRTNGGLIGNRRIPGSLSAGGVWNTVEHATYKRAGQWPGTQDLYYPNVRLLLQMDGSDNSTTITDTSSTPKIVTPVGNARIRTDQSKFGDSSAYFDGDGDSLSLPISSDWNLSTTDFTIECFVYKEENRDGIIVSQSDTRSYWMLNFKSTGTVAWNTSAVERSATVATVPNNVWTHIAVTKTGTTTRIFLDGVLSRSFTASIPSNDSQVLNIGGFVYTNSYKGYIDSLRITSVCRYTSTFTPPALPFPNG